MSYTAEICRDNPTCFLFLVDQSGSMAAPFGAESGKTKAQGVADAINRLLQSLVMRCTKGHDVLDRYHIGVVGYGEEIGLGFTGDLAGEVLQPISQINEHPLRVEERRKKMDDGAGGLVEQTVKFPVWFEPVARGKTLMCGAIQAAQEVIREFVNQHPNCFPPIVINVTDGKATDGDPEPLAAATWRHDFLRRQCAFLQRSHFGARRTADLVPCRRQQFAGRVRSATVPHVERLPARNAQTRHDSGRNYSDRRRSRLRLQRRFRFRGQVSRDRHSRGFPEPRR